MSHNNRVHNSRGNVPFSWEKKPGISKQAKFQGDVEDLGDRGFLLKLPPPPCSSAESTPPVHGFPIPPPPSDHHGHSLRRNTPARGHRKQDDEDPFLAAFKECTKTGSKLRDKPAFNGRSDFMSGLRSFFAVVPCKTAGSCAVRDCNSVRVSRQLPYDDDREISGSKVRYTN